MYSEKYFLLFVHFQDRGLIIRRVATSDQGIYYCTANNKAGRDRKRIDLLVGQIPSFVLSPSDIGVNLGKE